MKVVFLDFDGVLNSSNFLYGKGKKFDSTQADEKIDPEAVRRMNVITDCTGADIVVSSSWRIGKGVDDLRSLLRRHSVTGVVVGATPVTRGPRGGQISEWLSGHKVECFAVLDDCISDMEALPASTLVKTQESHGLLDEHVAQAIKILGVK